MREFKVRASSMSASYNAGVHVAESPREACEKAREWYRNSSLGRQLRDVMAFDFYVVDRFDYEEAPDAE